MPFFRLAATAFRLCSLPLRAALFQLDGRPVRNGGQDYDGLRLDDAILILDAGKKLLKGLGALGNNLQGIIIISRDVEALLYIHLAGDKLAEFVTIAWIVKADINKCHQVLVHQGRIEDCRILLHHAGIFQLLQPFVYLVQGIFSLLLKVSFEPQSVCQ